jgi:hypothetical protein
VESNRWAVDGTTSSSAQAGRVQRTARTWGEIWHVDGLAMALRDEAFRLRAPDDLSRVDWLYGDGRGRTHPADHQPKDTSR